MNVKRCLAPFALTAVLLLAPAARADAQAEAEAAARFEEGNKLWQYGNHEAARLKYVQAYAVLKADGVLFNLARAEMTVGHTEEAYRLFREFLKRPHARRQLHFPCDDN